jgi:pimeloyl-ACP methyl ester carboxylesterase
MKSTDMMIDVTSAVDLGEPVHIAATLHLPDDMDDGPLSLIYAIHGGGYTRAYWHPPFADDSYSFARYFCDQGKAVLAIDMLGMGQSSKPEPESRLTFEMFVAAHASALTQAIAGLERSVSVTGIGHSMGGMMIIAQAAAHPVFTRVAVLGWANEPLDLAGVDVAQLRAGIIPSGYVSTNRASMRPLFYWSDVPQELVEADEDHGSATPAGLGRFALTPGIVHQEAASITVPVLVVQSEIDTSPTPQKERGYFSSSSDVELQTLKNAAHCQNFASSRAEHWRDLNGWIDRTATASS